MITLWYSLVSVLLIIYVVLDGRNFGVGILHWIVAKTPQERRQVIASLGPLWSWHEVWLLSFGGTMLAVFPRVLAVSFAGYYLALFLILWCYILRGLAMEVGGHINDRLWQQFWDFIFVVSSTLLAVLFGAAAGNVVRGAPIDQTGVFSMAFFTNFDPRGIDGKGSVGLLDWYTVSIGVFAVIALCAHGATYLTLKTDGPVHDRSSVLARWLWIAVIPVLLIVTLETWFVHPQIVTSGMGNVFSWLGALVVIAATVLLTRGLLSGDEIKAFAGSNLLLIGILATGATAIYPVMLFSTIDPSYSLSAFDVASSPSTLLSVACWWPVAFILTVIYSIAIAHRFAGKVSAPNDGDESY